MEEFSSNTFGIRNLSQRSAYELKMIYGKPIEAQYFLQFNDKKVFVRCKRDDKGTAFKIKTNIFKRNPQITIHEKLDKIKAISVILPLPYQTKSKIGYNYDTQSFEGYFRSHLIFNNNSDAYTRIVLAPTYEMNLRYNYKMLSVFCQLSKEKIDFDLSGKIYKTSFHINEIYKKKQLQSQNSGCLELDQMIGHQKFGLTVGYDEDLFYGIRTKLFISERLKIQGEYEYSSSIKKDKNKISFKYNNFETSVYSSRKITHSYTFSLSSKAQLNFVINKKDIHNFNEMATFGVFIDVDNT